MSAHFDNVQNALAMLGWRLRQLEAYARAAAQGEKPVDREVMRRIGAIVKHLPAASDEGSTKALRADQVESLMSVLCATISQGLGEANEYAEKFSLLQERAGRRRGGGTSVIQHTLL